MLQACPSEKVVRTLRGNRQGIEGGRKLKLENHTMPQGDKSSYTDKQKRQAEHIEEGYEKSGVSKKEAESRAWATGARRGAPGRLR